MSARLEIDLRKIHHNAHVLVKRLARHNISVTGITKSTLGSPAIAEVLLRAGVVMLGDSRIENIEKLRNANEKASISLIRSPILSQIERVIEFADASFNTEFETIAALSTAAKAAGKTHGVVLMVELGDLREGIMPCDLESMVAAINELPNIDFKGIGTNLACRNGVTPDDKNMIELSELANSIDSTFGSVMSIVSGGNSANLDWVFSGSGTGRINNLRLGESILLGRNPLNREPIEKLYTDVFKLFGEVIEFKVKPAQSWGKIAQAAFGTAPPKKQQGNISQILLAIGEQDTDTDGLTPPSGLEILGASSDHIILNAKENHLAIGDEIVFEMNYSALLRSMTSPFVNKIIHE